MAGMRITFEDIWDGRLPSPRARRSGLPTIDEAGPDDRQVLVPDPGDPAAPASRIDELAAKPWIESVVADWPCQASRELGSIRTFIALHPSRTTRDFLVHVPNLEQIAARDVIPEDLFDLDRLRDAAFGWVSFDVPPGVSMQRLLDHAEEREPYRRSTLGERAIARLPQIERLQLRGFHYRDRADPIAELANLRWLSLDGWRNLRVLGRLVRLERLALIDIEMANLRAFRRLASLRSLSLMGRMQSVDGIEALQSLESVWLRGRVVRDLSPLVALPRLRELQLIYPDAVSDFAPLGRLSSLRRLEILLGDNTDAGAVDSVGFLATLHDLEEIELRNVDIRDRRLDPLFELPRLRRVTLTGRAGPNVDELRARRPEIQVETHLTGEPMGRVYVGRIHYDPPAPGIARWAILQSLADLLGTSTNQEAERMVRDSLARAQPELLRRLEFDSEAGAVGIYAGSEEDVRLVAQAISKLSAENS